jgi:hypothetical protein
MIYTLTRRAVRHCLDQGTISAAVFFIVNSKQKPIFASVTLHDPLIESYRLALIVANSFASVEDALFNRVIHHMSDMVRYLEVDVTEFLLKIAIGTD